MKYVITGIVCLFSLQYVCSQTDNLHLNQLQVIGSHNSYKKAIDPALFTMLSKMDSVSMSKIDYSHVPLTEQLNLGLCNLEIDVYADTAGGKYAHPKGLDWVTGQPAYDTAGVMKQPGFKVFHIPEIDFRSNCLTFRLCLEELQRWSAAHKNHNPVFITMNAKDDEMKRPGFTAPEKFTPEIYDALDKEITTYLGKEKLITPDEVRGKYNTLSEAVIAGNWPALKNARGKFIFILDETGDKIKMYVQNHPSLKGRIFFANAAPGTPEAAILIRNNPKDTTITSLVQQGYIVRTRADADTKMARENDRSDFEAACKSGAQIITTDYYYKSTHFKSDYSISFDNNTYFRINPFVKK
ncbi:phosphatidylinositol-specific phospholipase C1-like protein [Ferruginibacter sp. SUN106]|uniref:phosphatidylinositol-specific phospholipase C1-like protein n=1 Tax=Ferruginibacter sp. SUN106 TaxID=2978348 RepID=UPI003D35E4F5